MTFALTSEGVSFRGNVGQESFLLWEGGRKGGRE